jgi:hypothetical protein
MRKKTVLGSFMIQIKSLLIIVKEVTKIPHSLGKEEEAGEIRKKKLFLGIILLKII